MTFVGDESFQGPHAGQGIRVVLIRTGDSALIVLGSGTVSAPPDNISFSITLEGGPLDFSEAYQIHYWIDSNFGGGTVGVCDPPTNDHQWSVAPPLNLVEGGGFNMGVTHDAATVTDVCSTFAP